MFGLTLGRKGQGGFPGVATRKTPRMLLDEALADKSDPNMARTKEAAAIARRIRESLTGLDLQRGANLLERPDVPDDVKADVEALDRLFQTISFAPDFVRRQAVHMTNLLSQDAGFRAGYAAWERADHDERLRMLQVMLNAYYRSTKELIGFTPRQAFPEILDFSIYNHLNGKSVFFNADPNQIKFNMENGSPNYDANNAVTSMAHSIRRSLQHNMDNWYEKGQIPQDNADARLVFVLESYHRTLGFVSGPLCHSHPLYRDAKAFAAEFAAQVAELMAAPAADTAPADEPVVAGTG